MKNSLDTIEKISSRCSEQITFYTYNANSIHSKKYKKGRLTCASWINELCFYFIQKEKHLLDEFYELLEKKDSEFKKLKQGDYQQGLLDELNEIKQEF